MTKGIIAYSKIKGKYPQKWNKPFLSYVLFNPPLAGPHEHPGPRSAMGPFSSSHYPEGLPRLGQRVYGACVLWDAARLLPCPLQSSWAWVSTNLSGHAVKMELMKSPGFDFSSDSALLGGVLSSQTS